MSAKNVPDAPAASGDAGKGNRAWSQDESIKILLLIWQHENPDLTVNGWKVIGEKAELAFNKKFTPAAVK